MAFVLANESPAIANHSFRSYLFARLLARHKGMRPDHDFGDELLYLVCVLHDLGLTEHANGKQRFEVDGADAAVEFLSGQGVSSSDIDVVWQAIALHTSGGIAERRGPICQLTGGIALDIDATAVWCPTTMHMRFTRGFRGCRWPACSSTRSSRRRARTLTRRPPIRFRRCCCGNVASNR